MTDMFAPTDTQVPEVDVVREKYQNDPEKMLTALAHAQKHIATLEQERQLDREKLARSKTLDEVLEQIKGNPSPPPVPVPTAQPNTSVLDDNTLEAKLEELLNRKTQAQREVEAKQLVQAELLKAYSSADKAREELVKKSQELGMSLADMDRMSTTAPKAFLKLIGLDSQRAPVTNPAPSRGSVNVAAVQSNTPAPANGMDKFRNILKEDRNKAMSFEVQQAILADALSNPSAYGIKL